MIAIDEKKINGMINILDSLGYKPEWAGKLWTSTVGGIFAVFNHIHINIYYVIEDDVYDITVSSSILHCVIFSDVACKEEALIRLIHDIVDRNDDMEYWVTMKHNKEIENILNRLD